MKKGTQLLEIYALEIQMYTEQKNNKKLKALYEQSLHVKSAIPHPLIMGVIRECGGKMHLREGQFSEAHTDFFEAFKNYDESGNARYKNNFFKSKYVSDHFNQRRSQDFSKGL